MGSNKVTTCSYCIKRLRDCGYVIDRLFDRYHESDPRAWTIILDPGVASVIITLVSDPEDEYFELSDSGRYIPNGFKIKTSSIEVLVEYLVKFGINNKSATYHA